MAVSPSAAAVSSTASSMAGSMTAVSAALGKARPGVRSGSGSQLDPASSAWACSAISPFFRCSVRWAARSPLAKRGKDNLAGESGVAPQDDL